MATRMLIDARHPEETRVAVVKGNRIEEFDFEAAARKQIKGNIYLAKVTRVEPSLQAAFIDYGGNRHGFLAFSEIHPDYYQIPKEDREALLREEQRLIDEQGGQYDDGVDDYDDAGDLRGDTRGDTRGDKGEDYAAQSDEEGDDREVSEDDGQGVDAPSSGDEPEAGRDAQPRPRPEEHGGSEDDSSEALRRRRMALRRRYKIQEVIRRRQVMLVQVVKEERGNKGAALTTYISLAGRYSVLMPNTAQGGGISRKIANASDRKRLKAIMEDLALPVTMGAIVRTAGLERTRTEIKRDFDYLTRLWDEIRETTLHSSAPALIYEDSDLIKRAIRDIYSREIDEIYVDGEAGYKQARAFMKTLMPSHARKVQLYSDPVPLFHRAGVEGQLAAMMNPVVQLRSGGYIVINPTEALVAVDVNSGRSTREYNIEETALKTNIEAAEEVARQLRLRDMAGLVVVDFIDMDNNSNNRRVERALKDALRQDRARIQVGRISAFGLLEMSRQRLRTGVLEASTHVCPMCDGSGLVLTPASAALAALRLLEEEAVKGRASQFRLRADRPVAVYMLNRKRQELSELEERYGILIEVMPDDALVGARVAIDSNGPPPARPPLATGFAAQTRTLVEQDEDDDLPEYDEDETEEDREDRRERERERNEERGNDRTSERGSERGDGDRSDGDRRRKRRRRGGRGRDEERGADRTPGRGGPADAAPEAIERESSEQDGEEQRSDEPRSGRDSAADDGREPRKRRRRRRGRGGRGGEASPIETGGEAGEEAGDELIADRDSEPAAAMPEVETPAAEPAKPGRRRRGSKASEAAPIEADSPPMAEETIVEVASGEAAKPVRRSRKKAEGAAETEAAPAPEPAAEAEAASAKPKRARKPRVEAAEALAPDSSAEALAPDSSAEALAPDSSDAEEVVEVAPEPAPPAKPKGRAKPAKTEGAPSQPAAAPPEPAEVALAEAPATAEPSVPEATVAAAKPVEAEDPSQPPRRGWWQRTFGA